MQKNIFIAALLSLSLLSISILWATSKTVQKGSNKMVGSQNKQSPVVELNSEQAKLIATAPQLVIVDFYAEWCGPCKSLKPIFEEVAAELKNYMFARIDIDKCKDITKEYGITSIPTILIFSNGKSIERITGLISKDKLIERIKEAAQGPKDLSKLTKEQLNEKLIQAIQNNATIESIKALLDAGADANAVEANGHPVLMNAIVMNIARYNDPSEVVTLLLEYGASAEFVDKKTGQTANIMDFANQVVQNFKRMLNMYENVVTLVKNHEQKKVEAARCSEDGCKI